MRIFLENCIQSTARADQNIISLSCNLLFELEINTNWHISTRDGGIQLILFAKFFWIKPLKTNSQKSLSKKNKENSNEFQ